MKLLVLLNVLLLFVDIINCFNTNNHFNRNNIVTKLSNSNTDIKEKLLNSFNKESDIFVDPETLSPLSKIYRLFGFKVDQYYQSNDYDNKYPILSNYIDFTIPTEVSKPLWSFSVRELVGQNFFQNIFISSIYERGYRQNFETAGFPGIEEEFQEVKSFFLSANSKVVLDISCGSGFMTRKLFQSNNFERVIGADLSPTMLAETKRRLLEEGKNSNILPELVRCDSARLPFKTNSLDAVHAGAALHCWPRLSQALGEVYRCLKPGGVFYASTFFVNAFTSGDFQRQNSGFYLFKDEQELIDLCNKAGFNSSIEVDAVNVRREGRACAIVKCKKL